ncbi:hypothetical protein BUALT_Bualt07G0075400 [Buddleja alternifolia]|uniref:DDE Tnp4 domain-containing protein n=1 Tax=Buddleja alternifolia TaxID=168488 RepID=A0AAV6XJP7_9LAMI|nr:hypothetical protein BUALT_Bualt07G0075400 [Buddleja alternifolia]
MIVKFDFWRSGYTISVHFHAVLNAILKLHRILLVKSEPIDDNCNNARWKPFKVIEQKVLKREKPRYLTRKGSTADNRVLRDAVHIPNGLRVPMGYYYLGDAGYMNCEGFLTPYRSVWYHLDGWAEGTRAPQNAKEYYNMTHSKARNVIEHTWGCLKWRWAVLRSPTFYKIKIQYRIILACALLHNFIRKEMEVDPVEAETPDLHQETAIVYPTCELVQATLQSPMGESLLSTDVVGPHVKTDQMMKVFPGTDIRSSPNMNSKMHVWKKHFGMVYALLGSSSIGWNETTKKLEGSDEHWEKAIKVRGDNYDPSCKMLRHKPWPYYNHWLEIFGKDRAYGGGAEDCGDTANAVNQEQTQTEHQASPNFEGVNGYTPTLDEHEATSIVVFLAAERLLLYAVISFAKKTFELSSSKLSSSLRLLLYAVVTHSTNPIMYNLEETHMEANEEIAANTSQKLTFVTKNVDSTSYSAFTDGKFDMEKMKEFAAEWILIDEHPFSIIEEDDLNFMLKRGMPDWRGFSRVTTKKDCVE